MVLVKRNTNTDKPVTSTEKKDTTENEDIHKPVEDPFAGANKMYIPKVDKLALLRRLCDWNEPWVIIPSGSMFGYFDFIPKKLRLGPFHILMPFYIIGLIVAVIFLKPDNVMENLEPVYPELYSKWWYYNVIVGLWMSAFLMDIFIVRSWTLILYTAQSWVYLTLRHVLTALSPFLGKNNILLKVNEFLRLPSLVTATVTFTIWNFVIAPGIYFLFLDTAQKRKSFVKFNFSFRVIQLHGCNIIYAILNNISVSPRRSFTTSDLWCTFLLGVIYNLFYFLVLDRLGIHLYPIFSPRSSKVFLSSTVTWLTYYGAYIAWDKAIDYRIFEIGA